MSNKGKNGYCENCGMLLVYGSHNEPLGLCTINSNDTCNHSEYNPECITCRDIETQAGFDFKNGNFNEVDSWQAKVDHYNKPEPMEDEPSEDDYADRITDNEIQDRLEADIINMVNEEKV